MTLSELADFVLNKVGTTDEDSLAIAKDFATRRHAMIWNQHLWRDSLRPLSRSHGPQVIDQVGTVYTRYVVFKDNPEIERIIAVCEDDDLNYVPEELSALWLNNPEAFATTGGTSGVFTNMYRTPLWRGPDVLEALNQFGIQASCFTLNVTTGITLYGKAYNSFETSSTVTLTNSSAQAFQSPVMIEVTKMETTVNAWSSGSEDIQIVSTDDTNYVIGTIREGGELIAPTFPMIRLAKTPTTTTTVKAIGKLSVPRFSEDDDTMGLLNMENAMISFVEGDMLSRMRQRGKAQICYQEGTAHVARMINEEREQSGHRARVIPHVEPFSISTRGHWSTKTQF